MQAGILPLWYPGALQVHCKYLNGNVHFANQLTAHASTSFVSSQVNENLSSLTSLPSDFLSIQIPQINSWMKERKQRGVKHGGNAAQHPRCCTGQVFLPTTIG